MNKYLLLTLLILSLNTGFAQHGNPDKLLDACLNSIEGKTVESKAGCYEIAMENWQEEIDKIMDLLLNALEPHQQSILKHEQHSWLKYKEDYFKLIDEIFGHRDISSGVLLKAEEKYDFIKARTIQLREHHERYTRLFWGRRN